MYIHPKHTCINNYKVLISLSGKNLKLEKVVDGFCVVVAVILFRLVQILAQSNPLITSFVLRVEIPLWDEKWLSYNRFLDLCIRSRNTFKTSTK